MAGEVVFNREKIAEDLFHYLSRERLELLHDGSFSHEEKLKKIKANTSFKQELL